jgi:antitoxin (DNA-binding transcriptional repressor) of toxin-antitoxin stability system
MTSVSEIDVKENVSGLLDRGEQFIITRDGRTVARVIPEIFPTPEEVREAIIGLKALRERIRQRTEQEALADAEIYDAINEGRM